jgi:hypothetical protein
MSASDMRESRSPDIAALIGATVLKKREERDGGTSERPQTLSGRLETIDFCDGQFCRPRTASRGSE